MKGLHMRVRSDLWEDLAAAKMPPRVGLNGRVVLFEWPQGASMAHTQIRWEGRP